MMSPGVFASAAWNVNLSLRAMSRKYAEAMSEITHMMSTDAPIAGRRPLYIDTSAPETASPCAPPNCCICWENSSKAA